MSPHLYASQQDEVLNFPLFETRGTCQVHKVNKFRCHTRSSQPYRI